MAFGGQKAEIRLREITECSICMNAFTDPRVLPCIHTFCFQCLKRTVKRAELKPGDRMSCPLCRKEFFIPADGMNGVQKNVFMKNHLEFTNALQMGSATFICDKCDIRSDSRSGQLRKATMRCLECQYNYCDSCVQGHHYQKLMRNHQMVKIGSHAKSVSSAKYCSKHTQKPLDYYCAECKKIICVSCFVEGHKFHDCKDVTTVDKEFCKMIEKKAWKISTYADETLLMREIIDKRKADFLNEIVETEKSIYKRNQDLKDLIDRHTKSLVDELSDIQFNHLEQLKKEKEQIDYIFAVMKSFESYCTELRLKGSASDICSSVDQLIVRAEELEKDHEAFIGRPRKLVEVSFQTTDVSFPNPRCNVVGKLEVRTKNTENFENFAVIVGLDDVTTITNDVIEITLHRPNEISAEDKTPTQMAIETVAAVYCNMMFVTGIGANRDEIWKYNTVSGWKKCASLVQGRRRHSAAFIDEVLYICGGFVDSDESVLDSVEAYNAVANTCTTIGKLIHGVDSSGNCVPFKSSLYIFGGSDKDNNAVNHVQVYSTIENTCFVCSKPMPRPYNLMRAALLKTSVILLGWGTCFIFNIETETWQERRQFNTDVNHFGLVLENGRIFVIGGGAGETDKDGKTTWKCRDDVRYVPLQNIIDDKPIEWKIHGKLPKPSFVYAFANMRVLV